MTRRAFPLHDGVVQEKHHLKLKKNGPFLFVNKVAGQNTHAPDIDKPGLSEMLQIYENIQVYPVSRLDKGTSGALVFALDANAAAELSTLFEKHQVRKTYLFLSDKKMPEDKIQCQSFISKSNNTYHSDPQYSAPNSLTEIHFLKTLGSFYLYEAHPKSGKPHQIRLHAQDSGIPILGDQEHGGTPFYRLCLHSLKLAFEWQGQSFNFETPLPFFARKPEDSFGSLWEAVEKRQNSLVITEDTSGSFRWIHNESDDFRMDQFGSHLWVYWYRKQFLTELELQKLNTLRQHLNKKMWVREMLNRGAGAEKSKLVSMGDAENQWECQENGVKFFMRADQGQSPGLFLDQRENRLWVRNNSTNKSVLNLFCYTGGFSVNAALGGAQLVCSVDVSSKYLEWTKKNMQLNSLVPDKPRFEFWEADSLFFLKSSLKRGRRFDLIICDPPVLGRSKEGVFQIQKNLSELLDLCCQSLNSGGTLLLSTNFEGWNLSDLKQQVLPYKTKYNLEIKTTPPAGLDFELPHEPPLMKSLLAIKKNGISKP